ncbi:hypothetical protein EPO56_02375 [Patescibacteria group bacterium]|nr:MAG: hypothetical protein EPO56_02375 [Patescibacteria group bacterium]
MEDRTQMHPENGQFSRDAWYKHLIDIAKLSDTRQRYDSLVQLHQTTLDFYLPAVKAITPEIAASPSSDGRSRSLVVAHIVGWEEWQSQVFGDSDKDERLRRQMKLQGYYDTETRKLVDFEGVDNFNAYNAKRYDGKPWSEIQQKAINTALQLQSFFSPNPNKQWIDFLENTPDHNWRILPGVTLNIPSGWYLWMVSMEHEAVEHREDLIDKPR